MKVGQMLNETFSSRFLEVHFTNCDEHFGIEVFSKMLRPVLSFLWKTIRKVFPTYNLRRKGKILGEEAAVKFS